jgi:hypothetical protein
MLSECFAAAVLLPIAPLLKSLLASRLHSPRLPLACLSLASRLPLARTSLVPPLCTTLAFPLASPLAVSSLACFSLACFSLASRLPASRLPLLALACLAFTFFLQILLLLACRLSGCLSRASSVASHVLLTRLSLASLASLAVHTQRSHGDNYREAFGHVGC